MAYLRELQRLIRPSIHLEAVEFQSSVFLGADPLYFFRADPLYFFGADPLFLLELNLRVSISSRNPSLVTCSASCFAWVSPSEK